jgi:hypothetical protein
MAKANSTLSPDAQRLLRYSGHNSNWYVGTAFDLVEAGIIKSEWLPGVNGNAKTTTRVGLIDGETRVLPFGKMATRFQEESGLIHLYRRGKHKFEVCVGKTKEEKEQEIERENREVLRKEIERRHAEKKKSLDALPKNKDEFLAERSRIIRDLFGQMFSFYFCRADGGYHYSREVIEKARDLITDLIELAEEGKVYFDKTRYQYALDDIEERHVKANPEFSAFMASTLAIGKAALNEGVGYE